MGDFLIDYRKKRSPYQTKFSIFSSFEKNGSITISLRSIAPLHRSAPSLRSKTLINSAYDLNVVDIPMNLAVVKPPSNDCSRSRTQGLTSKFVLWTGSQRPFFVVNCDVVSLVWKAIKPDLFIGIPINKDFKPGPKDDFKTLTNEKT